MTLHRYGPLILAGLGLILAAATTLLLVVCGGVPATGSVHEEDEVTAP